MKRFAITLGAVAALAAPGLAQSFTLEDRNSTVNFDLANGGARDWFVDGVDQLFQQWFWVRVGNDTREQRIDSLGLVGAVATDTNPFIDNRPDTLSALFGNLQGLNIELGFRLQGGNAGSGASDLAEQITIHNDSPRALTISLFQYSDFDLAGTASGDTVSFVSPNGWRQVDPAGTSFNETVVTPTATRYQAGLFPSIVNSLDDAAITTLSNSAGPLSGDVSWAFQWDFTIGAGSSVTISKDKNFGAIPAPGAALLGMVGLSAIGWARRRLA